MTWEAVVAAADGRWARPTTTPRNRAAVTASTIALLFTTGLPVIPQPPGVRRRGLGPEEDLTERSRVRAESTRAAPSGAECRRQAGQTGSPGMWGTRSPSTLQVTPFSSGVGGTGGARGRA